VSELVALLSRVFALLTLGVVAVSLTIAGAAVWSRYSAEVRVRVAAVAAAHRGDAIRLAAAIAVVATAGSLFYSEVAGFAPCAPCGAQRAAMYPAAALLIVAAVRGARWARRSAGALAVVGLPISAYHYALERFPDLLPQGVCLTSVPCTVRWVDVFGFISIPFMAGIGFLGILMLLALHAIGSRSDQTSPPQEADHADIAQLDHV
jgi:disulfide bond formation protein DsbB